MLFVKTFNSVHIIRFVCYLSPFLVTFSKTKYVLIPLGKSVAVYSSCGFFLAKLRMNLQMFLQIKTYLSEMILQRSAEESRP